MFFVTYGESFWIPLYDREVRPWGRSVAHILCFDRLNEMAWFGDNLGHGQLLEGPLGVPCRSYGGLDGPFKLVMMCEWMRKHLHLMSRWMFRFSLIITFGKFLFLVFSVLLIFAVYYFFPFTNFEFSFFPPSFDGCKSLGCWFEIFLFFFNVSMYSYKLALRITFVASRKFWSVKFLFSFVIF